jgi:hypothetical protein
MCLRTTLAFLLSASALPQHAQREPYRDSGVNYEAMSAQKNAPRWIKALKKLGMLPKAKPALA